MKKFFKFLAKLLSNVLTPTSKNGTTYKPTNKSIVTSYKNEVEVDKDAKRTKRALQDLNKCEHIEVKEYVAPQHGNVMKYKM